MKEYKEYQMRRNHLEDWSCVWSDRLKFESQTEFWKVFDRFKVLSISLKGKIGVAYC